MSLTDFQRFLDINTVGMFLVTREVSTVMRAQDPVMVSHLSTNRGTTRGSIVNLGSASSLVAAPGVLPYTTSKHGALGLSKNAGEIAVSNLQASDNADLHFSTGQCATWDPR
jgi:NAD(P)-dependent dehydrogenase (short-subunit alcohol dehydrogenase family)